MPLSRPGWTHSSQLILPRQRLSPQEVAPFLSWVFGNLARKPQPLKLKEAAGVARYLLSLAYEMPGGPERFMLEQTARVIWLAMLNAGQIQITEKLEVIRFLRCHAATYLAGFDVERIAKQVDERAEPSRHERLFRPPQLTGLDR